MRLRPSRLASLSCWGGWHSSIVTAERDMHGHSWLQTYSAELPVSSSHLEVPGTIMWLEDAFI